MNKSFLILFVIGIVVGEIHFIVSGIVNDESLDDDSFELSSLYILDEGGKIFYYVVYAIFIPISVFPVIKKKITNRWLNLYAFIGGLTFHYAISQIIFLIST